MNVQIFTGDRLLIPPLSTKGQKTTVAIRRQLGYVNFPLNIQIDICDLDVTVPESHLAAPKGSSMIWPRCFSHPCFHVKTVASFFPAQLLLQHSIRLLHPTWSTLRGHNSGLNWATPGIHRSMEFLDSSLKPNWGTILLLDDSIVQFSAQS